MNKFRTLRPDEIDCRVAQVKEKFVTLLLYKDARCDQNILDETVGPMNWQRHHGRDNANCIVSIWDEAKQQWIEKEDVGTESRTEREKGLASDSFKRACFNWGIGRELYTAPFIMIPASKCNIKDGKCFDNFTVEDIEYQPDGAREIRALTIRNEKTGSVCYTWKVGERKVREDFEPSAPVKPSGTPADVTAMTPEQSAEKERKRKLKEYAMMAYGSKYADRLNAIYQQLEVREVTPEKYEQIKNMISADIASKKGAA